MAVKIPNALEDLPVSSPRWVGRSVKGVEDHALVTGQTEFTDNVSLPGMLHCAIKRRHAACALSVFRRGSHGAVRPALSIRTRHHGHHPWQSFHFAHIDVIDARGAYGLRSCGADKGLVYLWEREFRRPRRRSLERVAEVLGVSVEYAAR